ncbi:ABC transporter permease [Coriobacteriia bacterium Es71-Z0120]|uniref:ABC transporter permease n=1 Tax=Parvivirga hydrogeniphila TaxID=2939460 RepID=UPI002260FA76|nr:ABC transporter permease [Parvivirga hydrogeniphila]MCL4079422.1 ABC transporter permease [Parvivirga hydrogeniphila]
MDGPDLSLHARARAVAVSGAALGIAAALGPFGLVLRVNRIARGEAVSLFSAFGPWGVALVACWAIVAVLALSSAPLRMRGIVGSLAAGAAPVLALWQAGSVAARYTLQAGDLARVSLGAGFWLTVAASYIAIFAATAWLKRSVVRGLVAYGPFAAVAALLASGALSSLGIVREYANNAEAFAKQMNLHVAYVGVSVLAGLVLGLALGLLAARKPATEPVVFGALNVLQVLPTLAFIGLLYPVLTDLSRRVDLFAAVGVHGVGWAPVVIVLSAYAVYPIARNTHAAFVSLEPAVIDAARGIGMGPASVLAEVELPLAAPVILAGLRVALVQSTAGAIIAGLVGGGGLGTFVFLGASETASDLILLGVLPIVALGLAFDRGLTAVETALTLWREPA